MIFQNMLIKFMKEQTKNILINNIKDYEPNNGYEENEDYSDEIYDD